MFIVKKNRSSEVAKADVELFIYDQYGSSPLKEKSRRANSNWMAGANTVAFIYNSWSRIYKRKYNAASEWYGDARPAADAVNAAATWTGEAVSEMTGTVLFSLTNLSIDIRKTKRKWKL